MAIRSGRGMVPPSLKEPAVGRAIDELQEVRQVYIPLVADDGRGGPAVESYRAVLRGDVVQEPVEDRDVPVLASVSGVLAGMRTFRHPLYHELTCAVIDCMVAAKDSPVKERAIDRLTAEDILHIARQAAVIDELDGVPLHEKLRQAHEAGCAVLVADATQPEPYASSALAVLRDAPEQVQAGLRLAERAAGASGGHIAAHLPGSLRRGLTQKLGEGALYETGRRYPVARYAPVKTPGALMRIGVQACLALWRAAVYGEAHGDVVVTVAGDAVANAKNVRVPFGTPVEVLLEHCGLCADPSIIILGDALTGATTPSADIPVLPGMTCIVALRHSSVRPASPCIGCGRCAQVCHAGLLPYEIVRRLENMHYERLVSLKPEECDGCGACSYICPAGRDVAVHVREAGETQGAVFLNWGDDDDV